MRELVRSNDAVHLSWVVALLKAEGIEPIMLDAHTSAMEGSISAIQRRIAVLDEDHARAESLLREATAAIEGAGPAR